MNIAYALGTCKDCVHCEHCGQVGQFERRKLVNIPYVFVIINIYAFWSFKLYTQKNMNFRRFATIFIVFLVLRGICDTTNGFRLNVLLKSDTVFRLRFYVVFIVDVMNQFQVKIWFFTSAKCTSYNWSLKPVACWRCSIFLSPSGDLGIDLVWDNWTRPVQTSPPPTFWSHCWNPLQTEPNFLGSCYQDDFRVGSK